MQVQKPSLVQTQKLKLSPQMFQRINIMALPLLDLRSRINQELEENPALDIVSERETLSIDSIQENVPEESWLANASDPGFNSAYDQTASDNKQNFMENALYQTETLLDHLIWQLHLQPLSQDLIELGELLIRNLDINGFHIVSPKILVPQNQWESAVELMSIIQSFDPIGCCTQDYLESLEVQASCIHESPDVLTKIIHSYLPEINKGQFKMIANALSENIKIIEHCVNILKSLNPFPGREYSRSITNYVVPDVIVSHKDNTWKIIVNEEVIPVLGLNSSFNQMKGQQESKSEASHFMKNKIRDAKWFINSIQQRHSTLKKVAIAIVEYQRDFFLQGPKGIVPMTLKNVAEDVGVHETTISRLTRGKYMQTELGIFELKYFFTNAIRGIRKGGGNYGKVAVKEIVKEILERGTTLSDQKVSNMLEKRGIKIARRTVAKYRKELNISSSYER